MTTQNPINHGNLENTTSKNTDKFGSFNFKRIIEKFKYTDMRFSKSKIILLIILLLLLIIIYFALLLLSTRTSSNQAQIISKPATPIPEVKTDTQIESISKKIDNYFFRLNNSFNYTNQIAAPAVDFNVNF